MRKLETMTSHTGVSDDPSALTDKDLEAVTGGAINPFLLGDIKGESGDLERKIETMRKDLTAQWGG